MSEFGDQLVGLAQLIAEANGTEKTVHIREKIAEMVIYATMVRSGLEAAIANAEESPEGWYFPSELYTNAAKHYAAADYSLMVRHLHDIGGGSILTAPSLADLDNDEVGLLIKKYMRTKEGVDGETAPACSTRFATSPLTPTAAGSWSPCSSPAAVSTRNAW